MQTAKAAARLFKKLFCFIFATPSRAAEFSTRPLPGRGKFGIRNSEFLLLSHDRCGCVDGIPNSEFRIPNSKWVTIPAARR
jgi:hypothetical protein